MTRGLRKIVKGAVEAADTLDTVRHMARQFESEHDGTLSAKVDSLIHSVGEMRPLAEKGAESNKLLHEFIRDTGVTIGRIDGKVDTLNRRVDNLERTVHDMSDVVSEIAETHSRLEGHPGGRRDYDPPIETSKTPEDPDDEAAPLL